MKNQSFLIFTRVFVFIVIIVVLHYARILTPIEKAIIYFIGPISSSIYSINTNLTNSYLNFKEKKKLSHDLKILKIKYNTLLTENQELKYLNTENNELKKLLNFSRSSKQKTVLANIISKPVNNHALYSGMIIDKGIKDGLTVGLIVVDNVGMVIGKIINLNNEISEVCLVTQKKCEFAVFIQNSDITSGLTSGELELTVRMNFIPQNKLIKLKDIVVTSGLESGIPAGLVIGEIIQIIETSNDIWKSAIIEPKSDIDSINIVSVILPNQ